MTNVQSHSIEEFFQDANEEFSLNYLDTLIDFTQREAKINEELQ